MSAAKAPANAQEGPKTLVIENTEKRDTLIAAEKRYQKLWAESKAFESDAPSIQEYPPESTSPADLRQKKPKFFGTMAYPYMNGTLHAGHSFTASKVEFATGYARMEGKNALWPQGYHCTGMPIRACADKLQRELEMFGENFEGYRDDEVDEEPPAPTQAQTKEDITKFTAKKGKAAAKATATRYQFQIMEQLGLPRTEIHKFADANYWLHFFPPLCKRDLTNFGARIDWRRSMVTTDANPYYNRFVEWQMNRLKELGKIRFGKRYTVYSPKDGQPCMDHDRSTGEGVGVQEYTALKLKVKEWSESAWALLSSKMPPNANVYFVPATLRPETMYGQTCCFVGPKIPYGIFKASEGEYFFLSERAARNMAFQAISPTIFPDWGVYEKVAELQGSDVIGTLVNAPLSVHNEGVRILPMETVKATKGTGVVTSVPSDSPDDYATVVDLAKKADYYHIKKEWAELEIIPIINTPTYGNLTAPTLVKKLKINSPKDEKQLAEAKDLAYKEGFYQGTMLVGEFKGEPVQEAKNLVRQSLIDAGDAFNYAESDGLVISRSGDECVAAHLDQWYLNYGAGDPQWQKEVLDWVDGDLNTFSGETKRQFEGTIDWLGAWACARSYGLGTRLPWDQSALVESLSDSTIYPAYYTISHYLHSDVFGKEPGLGNVKAESMTDEVWDYVFARTESVTSDIDKATLEAMRRAFTYHYPLDERVSGKDLIPNHLTFFLYIHLALFKKEYWPRAIRANGHLMLNGEKMSKSTGNFLTLADATNKFGADATRIALADAGDDINDANFDESVANASILKLFELRKWMEEMMSEARVVSSQEEYSNLRDHGKIKNTDVIQRRGPRVFWDEVFANELNELVKETQSHFEGQMWKLGLKSGFYDFTAARDAYRVATSASGIGMHQELVHRYIELQALMLTVIAPHWSEGVWLEILRKPETVQNALFPTVPAPDPGLTAARQYVRNTSSSIGSAEGQALKKLAKGKAAAFDIKKDKKLTIFVASKYPAFQEKIINLVCQSFERLNVVDVKEVTSKVEKSEMKKAMPIVQGLKKRLDSGESSDAVFEMKLPFDELEVLRQLLPGLKQTVQKLQQVELISVDEGGQSGVVVTDKVKGERREGLPAPAQSAVPGSPTFHFENI